MPLNVEENRTLTSSHKHDLECRRKQNIFCYFPELDFAFRLVRKNIGHGWKDLARALPYSPAKDAHEINNEIHAIEYENHGKLKEQVSLLDVFWNCVIGQQVMLTLTVLVATIDAQWEGMGDVGSARYELALLPPCPTIRVLSYSN